MDDWISRLLDEILVHILSLLPMKEAAKTSVLSKRWRYLWTRITCLNFDRMDVVKNMRIKIRNTDAEEREDVVKMERINYINWVNKICSSIQAPSIEQLRICFDLGEESKDNLDKWVEFAIEKKVRNLELILDIIPWKSKRYILSTGTVSVSSGIKHLKSLSLKYINISGELLEHILLHCPSMERISVQDSQHLTTLRVAVVGLQNLKFLKIFDCFNLKDVQICAPNLSDFQYEGQPISLNIENANPSLTHLYIGGKFGDHLTWAFRALSSYLCQIHTLVLHLQLGQLRSIPQLLKLSSVRELTVRVSGGEDDAILYLLSLLKASPFLEKFRFENAFGERGELVEEKDVELCPHEHLKVLEIVGFVGRPNEVNFVRHLSRATIRLEKLVIDPMTPWVASGRKHDRILLARRFAELLRSEAPGWVEFVVL